jgi:sec-independent protein translocase protein TatC
MYPAMSQSNDFDSAWRTQFEVLRPHLDELRRRLLVAVIALFVATAIAFAFTGQVIEFIAQPVGGRQGLQAIEMTENLGVYMRTALTLGAVISMPVIVYEIVAFIVPGLTKSEQRLLFLALPFIVLMFLAGAAFAYFVMLPVAIPFLISFGDIPTTPRPKDYISFVTRVVFWIGVAFETPLIIALLARLGIVTPDQLRRGWRLAIVIIAVVAAMITPTIDPVNMLIVMGPLLALYVLSIFLARWTYRQRSADPRPDAYTNSSSVHD